MTTLRFLIVIACCMLQICLMAQERKHIVQSGEDFVSIAEKYGITVDELKAANPIGSACYVGRRLVIPQKGVAVKRNTAAGDTLKFDLKSGNDDIITKSSGTTYQAGMAFWNNKKYYAAHSYLLAAAQQGEKRAYYTLANCFALKDMPFYNEERAAYWFFKATDSVRIKSEPNYWMACLELSNRFLEGKGFRKDIEKARQYYNEYRKHTTSAVSNKAIGIQKAIKKEEDAIAKAEKERKERLARQEAERKQREALLAKERAARAKQAQQTTYASASTRQRTATTSSASTYNRQQASATRQPYTVKNGLGETTFYPQADGSVKTHTKSPCVWCYGSMRCNSCMYAGMVQSVVSYNFVCPQCNGTRMCLQCKGRGYTESWGVISGGIGYSVSENGNVVSTGGGSSSGSSSRSSRSSSSSSSSTTRDRGIRVKEYAPNYTASDIQKWCDECGGYDYPHVHIWKK